MHRLGIYPSIMGKKYILSMDYDCDKTTIWISTGAQ